MWGAGTHVCCGIVGMGERVEEQAGPIDFVRAVAAARITMPASHVRLSARLEGMSDETQALCFLAGANSIFYGGRLLTTPNPATNRDMAMIGRLGMRAVRSYGRGPSQDLISRLPCV